MMARMVADIAAAELDAVHARIAGRFARSEPRARAREYVSGLVAGLERKNGWTLAERAGEVSPDEMQRLLRIGRSLLEVMPYPDNLDHHFVVDPTKFGFYSMDYYRHLAEDAIARTWPRK